MNLVIDIGNTRIKAALFKEDVLFDYKTYNTPIEVLADTAFIYKASNAIIGSVVEGLEDFYKSLDDLVPALIFNSSIRLPLTNLYQSANTLGSDRLSASVGALYLYRNKDVLVIDAGTCIKYNFTNSKNEYLGGGISPGIHMRFKALQQFTSKLPLIKPSDTFVDLIGTNTENSIMSGVLNGSLAEIDGIIDLYKLQYPQILVLLTGGDSDYLAKRLKNSIFAHQNLVLKGLNDILNYNLAHK
ncbi:MAG: type III pantothenate kinase [Burkholderiales bacterium]|nr:type III pantothenate kinase [Bacteroidia bacterium]